MVRTSKHTLKFCNKDKQEIINKLICDYRILVQNIIDHIWENGYERFSIKNNKLYLPKFLSSSFLKNFPSTFSERLKQCAGKQALGMLGAATEKRRKPILRRIFYDLHSLKTACLVLADERRLRIIFSSNVDLQKNL